jgi:two-component system, cell cycle response regulator
MTPIDGYRQMRFVRAVQGAMISLGAPLGWFLLGLFGVNHASDTLLLYAYMLLGSLTAFTLFGYMIGSREDESLRLSLMDHVTGVFNARYFQLRLGQEFATSIRSDLPLSIIIFDLDRFKSINDEYGHPAGDVVLKRVAQAIDGSVRAGDVTARVGGEEFAVLLPNTVCEDAHAIAERIRQTIKTTKIELSSRKTVSVTISAGVISRADHPDSHFSELFELADQALFRAKNAGRDKVMVA